MSSSDALPETGAPRLRIGARRSPLAVAQAEWVRQQLIGLGAECELIGIDTQGDTDRRHLTEIGGTGVFAMAVRAALLDGSIDIAVHSMKDLPTAPAPGLEIAAVPEREDPRDVLVGCRLADLADGMVIGTGSPRRESQLRAYAAARGIQLEFQPIRGNVDRRLDLVRTGEVQATLLAAAGLQRLGRLARLDLRHELLPVEVMLPAAAQGALAIEIANPARPGVREIVARLDHAPTRARVTAEREFLRVLEAGCLAPVGVLARAEKQTDLTIAAVIGKTLSSNSVAEESGTPLLGVRGTAAMAQPAELGARLARSALQRINDDQSCGPRRDHPEQNARDHVTTTSAPLTVENVAPPPTAAVRGRVIFVGTGPGDPDLLTLGAVAAIAEASAVILDREQLRGLFHHPAVTTQAGAEILVIPTQPSGKMLPPSQRAKQVLKHAGSGSRVVRLVAGDPFLDSAVADEAAACVRGGIDFEVVPGVSALTAVPEYAGVSLAGAGGLHFVSATERIVKTQAAQWASQGTLVISTRAGLLIDAIEASRASGRPAEEPALVTYFGGSTEQQTVAAGLGDLIAAVEARAAGGAIDPEEPVHLMIGPAVEQRDGLSWYETKPLFGWRVLVPRTKDQAGPMTNRLRTYGAHSEEVPTISVEPPRSPQQIDKAVRGLVEGRFEWVAFTSVNAVKAVREKLEGYGLDARALSGLKVAAVGRVTASALRDWGIEPDLVPVGEQSAAGLAAEWPPYDETLDPINRVFLPRADIATETLSAGLTRLGWVVEDVTAYRTVRAAPPDALTREAIKTGQFDAVVFTSSSTVRNLVGIAGKPHVTTVIAVIGPATARTCEEHGLRVDVMAPTPGSVELADALASFAAERRDALIAAGEKVLKPSQLRRSGTRRRS